MSRTYLGRLAENDPLHGYLQYDIQPQINGASGPAQYRVFRLNGSNDVYLYEDRYSGAKVVGKFFLSSRKRDAEKAAARGERYPEFDAIGIFREIITRHSTDFTRRLPPEKLEQLPRLLAETHRAVSRFRLQLYSGVEDTVKQLRPKYHLAIVSDGQTAYAIPELNAVGLFSYFDPVIVSGDFGYRKLDKRLLEHALQAMEMDPSEVLFVGNDMYCVVYGAQRLGMKTSFFTSNQGAQEKEGVTPDYIIYNFPELLNALRFFEKR